MTRTDKATGEVTTLSFEDAVDQFIRDNLTYAISTGADIDPEEIEEYLSDMSTVFETRNMLNDFEAGDDTELDAGLAIYKK